MKIIGYQQIVLQAFGKPSECKKRAIHLAQIATSPTSKPHEKILNLQLISVDSITPPIGSYKLSEFEKDFIQSHHILLADPEATSGKPLTIDILIGQDFYYHIIKNERLILSGGLAFIPTINGYALGGSVESSHDPCSISTINFISKSNIEILGNNEETACLKSFTSLENIGIGPLEEETSPILDRFNTTTRHNGFRYTVVLPKRLPKLKKLKTNCLLSFNRLINTHKRLTKKGKEEELKLYSDIINEQLQAGVLEKVNSLGPIEEVRSNLDLDPKFYDKFSVSESDETFVHYLPHFSVRKKSSGKMRLVYDAAAKISSGFYSLNDCLETGPDLINSLLSILIRFRLFKYAMKSDIQKAFLQIEIEEIDRDLLRSFWIEGNQVVIYRFARLPFGLTCSPFILAATLQKHLKSTNLSPAKQKQIMDDFYVDDNITGADDPNTLLQSKNLLETTFKEAGMILSQFNTNNLLIRKILSQSNPDLPEYESILGISWDLMSDQLTVNSSPERFLVNSPFSRTKIKNNTKREVYSTLGKAFDPCGFVSPFTFTGKILLRDICENVKTWDTLLPERFLEPWQQFKSQLPYLSKFNCPRYVNLPDAITTNIVGFCDASQIGFAANIYFVTKNSSGEFKSNLILSKTRIAPKSVTSIPRLELCGALLLSNMMTHIKKTIPQVSNDSYFYFTDSLNVLYWLRSESFDWPVFVSNRLKQCLNCSEARNWKHVSTQENPADIPSRGCSLSSLCQDTVKRKLFLEGPGFLEKDLTLYQSEVDIKVMPEGCKQEIKKVSLNACITNPVTDIRSLITLSNFSTYRRLLTFTNLIIKATKILCTRLLGMKCPESTFNPDADILWIKAVQQEHYSDFFVLAANNYKNKDPNICSNISAVSKNKFLQSNIFLDTNLSILRCRMRTQLSSLTFEASNPILLPPESPFTILIVKNTHERLLHAGLSQTAADLRGKYWIPQIKRTVAKVTKNCFVCRKAYGKAYPLPPAPDLPDFRVNRAFPFRNVGLDYAGPFHTRERFVDKTFFDYKSYILIFTCTCSRAVHFEATNSLNAYDFRMAFQRFISDRGAPKLIISDNALTFHSSKVKFNSIFKDKDLRDLLVDRKIEWEFYTDKAPWKGGFIERVVRLFKTISNKLINSHHLSFEEFRTFVKTSQAVVNSRPLTYLCEGLEEGTPLTPSMLMHGFNLTDIPSHATPRSERSIEKDSERNGDLTLEQRYRVIENLKDSFWNRFSKQYLTELHERHLSQSKIKAEFRVPKVGDICLLKKEVTPRRHWPLAVIERVDIGERDGRVRTVGLKTHNSNGKISRLERSPCFLVPLEGDLQ